MTDKETSKPLKVLTAFRVSGKPMLEKKVRKRVKTEPGFEEVRGTIVDRLVEGAFQVVYQGGEDMTPEERYRAIVDHFDGELK